MHVSMQARKHAMHVSTQARQTRDLADSYQPKSLWKLLKFTNFFRLPYTMDL